MGTHLNYLAARERVADLSRAAERARLARGVGEDALPSRRDDGLFARVLAVARRSRSLRPSAGRRRASRSRGRDAATPAVAFDDHDAC